MPTRASTPKRREDSTPPAHSVVEELTGGKIDGLLDNAPVDTRNQAAVALSKLGASKGGLARAAALSDRKRKMIARKAAEARWRGRG